LVASLLADFFKPLVAVMPLTYLSDALRQLMVGTAGLHPLWLRNARKSRAILRNEKSGRGNAFLVGHFEHDEWHPVGSSHVIRTPGGECVAPTHNDNDTMHVVGHHDPFVQGVFLDYIVTRFPSAGQKTAHSRPRHRTARPL